MIQQKRQLMVNCITGMRWVLVLLQGGVSNPTTEKYTLEKTALEVGIFPQLGNDEINNFLDKKRR
jgi:hypothetical protein